MPSYIDTQFNERLWCRPCCAEIGITLPLLRGVDPARMPTMEDAVREIVKQALADGG